MNKSRFYALRMLSLFYIVIGWIITGLSILAGISLFARSNYLPYDSGYYSIPLMENGSLMGLLLLIGGILIGLTIVALGEVMKISVRIEKNTRATNQALEKLISLGRAGGLPNGSAQP